MSLTAPHQSLIVCRKGKYVCSFHVSPVFNILVHVGVVLTYPILISIGTLLSVPGNAGMILNTVATPPHTQGDKLSITAHLLEDL